MAIFLFVYWNTDRRFDFLLIALLIFAIHRVRAAWKSPQANYRQFVMLTSQEDKRGWLFILLRVFSLLILGYLIISKMLILRDYSTLSISLALLAGLLSFYVVSSLIRKPKPSNFIGLKDSDLHLIYNKKEYKIVKDLLRKVVGSQSSILIMSNEKEEIVFDGFKLSSSELRELKKLIHNNIDNVEIIIESKDEFTT